MLPPLNLAEGKRDFFPYKKLANGRRANPTPSKSRVSGGKVGPSVGKADAGRSSWVQDGDGVDSAVNANGPGLLGRLTLIPRDFFVVERNAILPDQYPPEVYQSTFTRDDGGGSNQLWETIVFPALAPHTRQQVLRLRQTLEKLRETLAVSASRNDQSSPTLGALAISPRQSSRHQQAVVEYSKQEARIYSVCFHELIRQVKCICKEQSELLHEVRERYDAIIGRLADRIDELDEQLTHRNARVAELTTQVSDLKQANDVLAHECQSKRRASVRKATNDGELKTMREGPTVIQSVVEEDEDDLNSDDDEDWDEGDDREEAKWQRRRRRWSSASMSKPPKQQRDSIAEENLAAARVQTAFHKYQMRRVQQTQALRAEKNAAALEIQRSFRGFRARQRAMHHRAVLQTIMRRRKQIAAVELLQANVRAYLIKQRNSQTSQQSNKTIYRRVPESSTGEGSATGDDSSRQNPSTSTVINPTDTPDDRSPRSLLCRILATSSELIAAVSQLKPHAAGFSADIGASTDEDSGAVAEKRSLDSKATTDGAGDGDEVPETSTLSPATTVVDDEKWVATPHRNESIVPPEDTALLRHTIQQTRELVQSLEATLAACGFDNAKSDDEDHSQGDGVSPKTLTVGTSISVEFLESSSMALLQSMQTAAIESTTPESVLTTTGTDLSSPPVTTDELPTSSSISDLPGNGDFHLDDSLWGSAVYYASSDTNATNPKLLLEYLSSREHRKRLVWLKQFIMDLYDVVIGRLRDLPPSQLADTIKWRGSLALSCEEWQQQRRALTDSSTVMLPFDLEAISREHFRCQLGLKNLVDAAMEDLYDATAFFAPVDPDVEVFHGFLHHERSYDEFAFRCICRFLCGRCAPPLDSRQPVFHPFTMREVIPVPDALQVARQLFRTDDQEALILADAQWIEADNGVYQQYLPSSGFAQCEAIVSSYFTAATDAFPLSFVPTGDTDGPAAFQGGRRSVVTTPRTPMMSPRPTNVNHFHGRQYNAVASRSPLIRRPQPPSASPSPRTMANDNSDTKWIFFDEFLTLLLKYRAEMHHFHLFVQWAVELFALAMGTNDPSRQRHAELLDEEVFAETLLPFSLGPNERELRNVFSNSLRQRRLQLLMPRCTFTAVVLLLLRSRMLSVARYAPLEKRRLTAGNGVDGVRVSLREEESDRAWRTLAQQWRAREPAFEEAVETVYRSARPGEDGSGDEAHCRVLKLLQLRNELYELFEERAMAALPRGQEVYEQLVDGILLHSVADGDNADYEDGSEPGSIDIHSVMDNEVDAGHGSTPVDDESIADREEMINN